MKYVVTVRGERTEVIVEPGHIEVGGVRSPAELMEVPGTPTRLLTIDNTVHEVVVRARHGRGHYTVWVAGYTYDVEALDERARAIGDLAGHGASAAGHPPLVAPMPGLVVRVNVRPGDQVKAGQGLVIMEAMKMENELRSHSDGRVKAVLVTAGTAVDKGAVLVELE